MADGFVSINYTVLSDKDLLLIEKVVYGAVYGLCSMRGYAWASNKYLAELLNVSERTITRSVTRLTELGYLTVKIEKNRADNGQITTQRHIYLTDKGTIGGSKIPEIDDRVDMEDAENDNRVDTDVYPPLDTDGEYNIKRINIKNLRQQSCRTKEPTSKQPSLTVQVDNILNEKLDKLEKEGNKVIRVSIPIQRKIIKNSLTFFDNDVEWIKAYISKALCDDFVAKSCHLSTVLFCKAVIAKYIKATKPVRYSEPAPKYEQTEADRAFEAMTPDERAAWIRKEKKRIRDEMEARK